MQTSFYFSNMFNRRSKQVVSSLVSIYFDSPQLRIHKNKLCKTLNYWSRDMFNFSFPDKSLGLVSPPYFVYNFSRKMFLMLYSINLLCSVVPIWEHIFITPILFNIDLTFAILLIALIKRRLANNIRVYRN